jgi:undecaprenyl-diphosphatase
MITALALLSTRWNRRNDTALERMAWWQALVVGVAQAVAITPGISRSGATIVAGLHARLDREAAGRFSFLLSIPAVFGAIVLETSHLDAVPADLWTGAFIGFIVSAVVGYGALRLLLWFVRFGRLYWFGVYCILAALFALAIS